MAISLVPHAHHLRQTPSKEPNLAVPTREATLSVTVQNTFRKPEVPHEWHNQNYDYTSITVSQNRQQEHGHFLPKAWRARSKGRAEVMRPVAVLVLALSLGALAVPLPEAVFYGSVAVDHVTQTADGRAEVSAWVGGRRAARYILGDLPGAGDAYLLSVPLGSTDEAGLAHVGAGDTVGFTVNGEETGVTVSLAVFGSAQSLSLDLGGDRVRAPVLDPPSGTQYGNTAVTITMASATPNATILYTLDGSEPASGGTATVYAEAIVVTADTDVRARAYDPAGVLTPSPIAGGTYLLRPADGDGDGLPDAWEQRIADARPYDRINSPSDVLPGDDFDRDGVANAAEFAAGSDPARDDQPPTVVAARAAGQTDPASSEPIHFIVTFSEPVTGFGDGAAEVVLGGTAGAAAALVTAAAPHDGTAYEIAVSGVTQAGSVTLSVPAGAAADSTGNPCAASNQVQVAYLPVCTLTYLAGAHGSIMGPTPQTVAPGGDSTLVTATPATGYHFARWSDGVLTATRTDRNVVANLTVTAEFAVDVVTNHTVTFLAGNGGRLSGTTPQMVVHGGSTTPVTAMGAYGYVFGQWSDASVQNPRTLLNVTSDLTLTASFRTANAVVPNGSFLAVVDGTAGSLARSLWDVSGNYVATIAGNPLAMNVVHDPTGRLSGTATLSVGKAATVNMPIKGTVRGTSGSIKMKASLAGTDPARTVSVSLALDLTVDTANRQLRGRLTGSIMSGEVTTPLSSDVALPIPTPMDGTWTLLLQLGQTGRAVSGTALLMLSNDVKHTFVVGGRTGANNVAILSLTGDPDDPASKAMSIRTTITPLEGGWVRLESFSARGYGQTVGW